ncbi:hypothetical protein V6N11_036827 [Hibiscus sabdariffa]|uniref:Uncharacterized protein n=1 Tax=Hibiscus sabdariffa TaxID=183260 RepID=A0ABR2RBI1_9ROSI
MSAEPEIPTQCSLPSVEAEVSAQPNSVTRLSSQPATLSSERVLQSATPDLVGVSSSIRVPIVYKCKSKFMSTQQQSELDNPVLQPRVLVLPSAQNSVSDLLRIQYQIFNLVSIYHLLRIRVIFFSQVKVLIRIKVLLICLPRRKGSQIEILIKVKILMICLLRRKEFLQL